MPEQILHALPVATLLVDQRGRICEANAAVTRVFQYSREELIDQPVEILIPDALRDLHRSRRDAYLLAPHHRPMGGLTALEGQRKDGSTVALEIGLTPIAHTSGPGVLASIVDISRRSRVESSLRDARFRLRGIIDNCSNFMGLLTPDGRLVDANRPALEAAGLALDDVLGTPFWETPWWTHSPELQQRLRCAVERAALGERDQFAATHPLASGDVVHVEFTLSPVRGDDGKIIYLVPEGHDFSVRRQQEVEIETHVRQLERANQELEQFAYVASHDLRAPLRGISQLCALVADEEAERLSEDSKRHLEMMAVRCERMKNLLDDLLTFSRIERGDDPIERVDVARLIDETIDLLDVPERFLVELPPNLPVLSTVVTPLRQVFMNLIGNAVLHHHQETGRISISVRETSDRFEFAVTDDGPGIAPEFHERIFEMFRRLRRHDEVEGTGLGLAIVRKFVRRFGGDITVRSTPGEGSTFQFSWPRAIETASR